MTGVSFRGVPAGVTPCPQVSTGAANVVDGTAKGGVRPAKLTLFRHRRYPVRVPPVDDDLARVWAEFDDAGLESTLFEYLWLAVNTPNSHANRIGQLIAEAERRGRPELVERAKRKAEMTPAV